MTKATQTKKGFTIIEVLIVLAIAGLILLIVFLAVPALQRNSRNTQRKSDVSALLGGVAEYTSNNQGRLPTTAAQLTSNSKLGFYDPASQVTYTDNTAAFSTLPTATGRESNVYVYTYAKCATATTLEATASNITRRNVVAVFYIETSNGTTVQCQDL